LALLNKVLLPQLPSFDLDMAKQSKTNRKHDTFDAIKRLAIVGLFSIDELTEKLVLKGGNAIDLVYQISTRASLDIDLSIPTDLGADLDLVAKKIERALYDSFISISLVVFDFKMEEVPAEVTLDLRSFWGGYKIEFKLISMESFRKNDMDKEWLRRHCETVGDGQNRKFEIEISKFEYCVGKVKKRLDDYTIYVYSPMMIVCEKLRAICQQMDDYREIVKKHKARRAKDFLDIYLLNESYPIDPKRNEVRATLEGMFAAKQVPLRLLSNIASEKLHHEPDFVSVLATVANSKTLKSFDFYFEYVLDFVADLKSFWDQ